MVVVGELQGVVGNAVLNILVGVGVEVSWDKDVYPLLVGKMVEGGSRDHGICWPCVLAAGNCRWSLTGDVACVSGLS